MEGEIFMKLHLDFMLFHKHNKKKDCKCKDKHKHGHKCDGKCVDGIKDELTRLHGRLVKIVTNGGYFIGVVGKVDCDTVGIGPAPWYYPITVSLCEINAIIELPYYPYYGGSEMTVADQLAMNYAGTLEVDAD